MATKQTVLTKKRGVTRQKITKIHRKIDEDFSDLTVQLKSMYLTKCKDLKNEVVKLDDDLLTILIDLNTPDEALQAHADQDEKYSDMLDTAIANLENWNVSANISENMQMSTNGQLGTPPSNNVKLPQIPLPSNCGGG